MKTKMFTLFFALAASVGTMFADGTKIGDLYYNLNATDRTAEVTYKSYANYSYNEGWNITTANIPASVTYSGTTYSVTSIGEIAFYKCSSLTSVTIPNSVTSIGSNAFQYCSSLTSVTIPNSVTSIGNYAFDGCTGLTSVTIPNSVTSIGQDAFSGCSSLTSVTIPNSVTSIGNEAFCGCSSLTSVTIPNSVTSIGQGAFYNCSSLTSVTIGNSVTSIGESAFSECSSLTSISVATDNPNYSSKDGVLFDKQQTKLVQYPGGKQGAYVIPNSVTSIGDRAFCVCSSLTSVTIPNSVTSIGSGAFSGCSSLTSVTIPNSVTSIGGYAFQNCSSLTSVTIGNSITSIGRSAFFGCSSLTSVTIPNSVTSIGNDAFVFCSSLTSVTIPNSVTSIGSGAFYYCRSLTSVTIPNSVTSIGYQAFEGCSGLTSATIGNSVTSIGGMVFYGCSSLTSVTLGTSVKVIEEYAFYDCTAIETITCYSMRPPTVNNGAFENLYYSTIVYVPADYLNTYKMHDFWGIYDVRPIGASKTETTEVKVEPTATTADIAWPVVENAATYELVIKDKSGNVVCTLIFNANGQLTSIVFSAPARDNSTQASGFSFTVTGLQSGTTYDLTITAKDSNGQTLQIATQTFTTEGLSGVEDIVTGITPTKVLYDGQILILRDGKTYTIQGQEVR